MFKRNYIPCVCSSIRARYLPQGNAHHRLSNIVGLIEYIASKFSYTYHASCHIIVIVIRAIIISVSSFVSLDCYAFLIACLLVEKVTGTVKWFSIYRHYGFIQRDDNNEDVFVHRTAITASRSRYPTLKNGETVEFSVVETTGGVNAASVTGPNGQQVKVNIEFGPSNVTEFYWYQKPACWFVSSVLFT